jgi:hypothetical protein
VTSKFRKAAYAAVEEARLAGLGQDDQVIVSAPPGEWAFTVGGLKAMLRRDQRRRKKQRGQRAAAPA